MKYSSPSTSLSHCCRTTASVWIAFFLLTCGSVFSQAPKPAAAPAKPGTTATKIAKKDSPVATVWRLKNREGRGYVSLKAIAAYYGFSSWDSSSKSFSAVKKTTKGEVRLEGLVGQKRVRLGNLAFYFSFPPLSGNDEGPLISVYDLSNVIDPVIRGGTRRDPSILRTVVIDPAGGGAEYGSLGLEGSEKQVTLAVALKMKPLLEQAGFTVVLTRDDDSAVFPTERIRLANLINTESIYINLQAAENTAPAAKGVETCTLPPANTPATNEPEGTEPDKRFYPGNINDRESMALATKLHYSLIGASKATDLGIKRQRSLELRGIEMPAVISKLGFLTNKQECALLFTEEYQLKLARSLAEGVINYAAFLREGLEARTKLDEAAPLKFGNPQATHLDAAAGVSGERVTIRVPITAKLGNQLDRSKMEIQLFMFERVNGTDLDLTISAPPKIEWLTVLPDWKGVETEIFQAIYDRPAMNSLEMAKLGKRNYYGFVARLVYDGVLMDDFSEPKNLNRCLYNFTQVFPRR